MLKVRMIGKRGKARAVAALVSLVCLGVAGPASAVRVSQHAIAKLASEETVSPATSIINGPQGLLITGSRTTAYQAVTTGPTFSVSAGAGSGGARGLFIGPDGQTWLIGGVSKVVSGLSVTDAALFEVGAAGPVLHFTFPAASYVPAEAVADSKGSVVVADLSEPGALEEITGETLKAVTLPFGSAAPTHIAAGVDGNLWATDLLTSSIAKISPGGEVVEYPLPGARSEHWGFAEPYGIAAAPDGSAWFTEQSADAIGRITASGEIQTFAIPAAPGTTPGGLGYPSPRDITIGPEGAAWYTDPGTNAIGRVFNGEVTELPIPATSDVVPEHITTVGSELWFTEADAPDLGSVNPALPAEAPAAKTPAAATIERRQVMEMLAVSGRQGRIGRLLQRDAYTDIVTLPAAGTVRITWKDSKHEVIADGSASLTTGGTDDLRIHLTSVGRRLLRNARVVKVSAQGAVVLGASSAVIAGLAVTLRR